MKKFFFMGIGIALTCIVFYACDVSKQLNDVNKAGYICSNYAFTPPNQMNKQDVIAMISNYYTNQYMLLHPNLNPNNPSTNNTKLSLPASIPYDSRAIFFSLDSIEKLVYFMRSATKNYSPKLKQNLGLNIYFASYPDGRKTHNGLNYTNRHTLVMLPSIFQNGQPTDFDLLTEINNPNSDTPKQYINNLFLTNTSRLTIGALGSTSSNGMGSQNNGTGTPPPITANGTGNPLLDITDPN
jgi:hypothetical protein